MKYKLKEMLWEFTLSCNKNCKYCGSKNFINQSEDKKIDRKHIAKEIASMKPKEVTFTGGEPSVFMKELEECADILNKKNIECKVLTNGNLFKSKLDKSFDDKFVCYGLSINEEEDIKKATEILANIPREKTTIITNFGRHNFLLFEKLLKFAVLFPTWQVQLTMGNEYQLDLNDIKNLQYHLDKDVPHNLVKVIKADNFVCGACKAGIECCSITWNGDVVPCLSYRAWKNNMMEQGNVFEKSLSKIWNEKFQFFRKRDYFPCCKNISGIEKIKENQEKEMFPQFPTDKNPPSMRDFVFVYGVVKPDFPKDWNDSPVVYGVTNPLTFN